MAYKSYDDLIAAIKQDPKLARHRIKRAEKIGRPVVSAKNSGYPQGSEEDDEVNDYKSKAISKRLHKPGISSKGVTRTEVTKKKTNEKLIAATRKRLKGRYKTMAQGKTEGKIITPMAQDEIVTKRKKVGY